MDEGLGCGGAVVFDFFDGEIGVGGDADFRRLNIDDDE